MISWFVGPLVAAWSVVRENWRAFVVLNILGYGLMIAAMAAAAVRPSLQDDMLRDVERELTDGPLASVGSAYSDGMVLRAIALTFAINLIVGSVAWITLPSLVIPFAGVLMGLYRAALWGLLFSPASPEMRGLAMLPHALTMLIEGQGYNVAMLASWVHGRDFVAPGSVGCPGHRGGYVEGLRQTGRVYPLVVLILFAAAVYEAVEVIAMRNWMGS